MEAWERPAHLGVYSKALVTRPREVPIVFGDGTDNPTFEEPALGASPGCLVRL